MAKNIFRVAFLSIALVITPSAYPLGLGMAQGISAAAGVGSAALIGLGMRHARFNPFVSTLGAVAGGAAVGGLAYYILYEFTPEGRTARATAKIERIMRNPMVTRSFDNEKDFLNALQEVYVVHELWLIGAFRELSSLLQDAYDVTSLVEKVRAEAPENFGLMQQCNTLMPRARTAISNITKAIKTIRENKEYIAQLKIQKEQEMRERELAIAAQQAQAAQTNAMAQISMANSQAQMVHVKRERNDIEGYKAAAQIAGL